MAQADNKLQSGDPIGAFEVYTRAYKRQPSPALKRKLDAAKAKAAPILQKLGQARKLAAKGKYREALSTYVALASMKGARLDGRSCVAMT